MCVCVCVCVCVERRKYDRHLKRQFEEDEPVDPPDGPHLCRMIQLLFIELENLSQYPMTTMSFW
jgi:hypothetical protein